MVNGLLAISELKDNPIIHIGSFLGLNADSMIWLHCECVNQDETRHIVKLAESAKVDITNESAIFSCELPLQELATLKDNSTITIFIMASLSKTTNDEPPLCARYQLSFQHTPHQINYARWMTDSVPGIEHLKLHELILLSAHNAGVDQKNAGWPTDQWGACQDDSFSYQLNNGARVLDLRLYRNIAEVGTPKEFIFKHGSFHSSRYLNDCLQAVREFTERNPMEFVILDFHEVNAAGGEQQINSAIIDKLGDYRLPYDARNLTIGEIRSRYPGKRVIIAWNNPLSYANWPRLNHEWTGQDTVSDTDLYVFIKTTMENAPTRNLWSLQAVGFNALNGPIRYDANRLFWREFFDAKFFDTYRTPIKGNIINVDFLVGTGAAQKCINATRDRAAAALRSAPRNLNSAFEASWVLCAWEPPQESEHVTGYSIFRNNTRILDTPQLEPFALITFLKPDTTYTFRVVAKFNSQDGAGTVTTVTTKSPKPTAPAKPKNAIAHDKTHHSATLTWDAAPPSENIAGYLIWVNDGNAITVTGTTYKLTGLNTRTRYEIDISAFNSNNEVSSTSAIAPFNLEPLSPPETPKNLRGTALPGKIKLEWDSAIRAVSYEIYTVTFLSVRVTTETTSTFERVELLRDYTVVAFNEHGEVSGRSNTIWLKPLPPEAPGEPGAPKNFRVVYEGRDYVDFAWDVAQHAVSYELNRLGSISPVGRTTGTTLKLSGLASGKLRYNVVAVYADGSKSEKSEFLWAGPPN